MPDYDTDIIKHYVRKKGWVVPFRSLKNKIDRQFQLGNRVNRCKYLTFCAKNAIDIFLLEKEAILYRNPNTLRLENVYFCEQEKEDFHEISRLVGNANQGFFGNFQNLMLTDYSAITVPDEATLSENNSESERLLLFQKRSQENLVNTFPFDIINYDVCGNFFPDRQNIYSEQCRTFSKVLDLQKNTTPYGINEFLMFLTIETPVREGQVNPDIMQAFLEVIRGNLEIPDFNEHFINRFGEIDLREVEYHLLFTLGFLKLVLLKESYKSGWYLDLINLFCYDRIRSGEPYKMSNFIILFKRDDALDNIQDFHTTVPTIVRPSYLEQLCLYLNDYPVEVSSEDAISENIETDLQAVVDFRNQYLNSINN